MSHVPCPSSLVLTGFMGTGKTTVGKIIAQKLGREFVDMDTLIEAREGKSVAEIFRARGEKHFRLIEQELCAELGEWNEMVIATGGGTLVSEQNRARFANALVVCLDARVEEIAARLQGGADRPLLAGGDLRARVEELFAARRAAYAQIENHNDTSGKSAEQVADEVVALYRRMANA